MSEQFTDPRKWKAHVVVATSSQSAYLHSWRQDEPFGSGSPLVKRPQLLQGSCLEYLALSQPYVSTTSPFSAHLLTITKTLS